MSKLHSTERRLMNSCCPLEIGKVRKVFDFGIQKVTHNLFKTLDITQCLEIVCYSKIGDILKTNLFFLAGHGSVRFLILFKIRDNTC